MLLPAFVIVGIVDKAVGMHQTLVEGHYGIKE